MSQAKRKRSSDPTEENEAETVIAHMAEQIAQLSSRVSALESAEGESELVENESGAEEADEDCAMEGNEDSTTEGGDVLSNEPRVWFPMTVWHVLIVHYWDIQETNGSHVAQLRNPEIRSRGMYTKLEDAKDRWQYLQRAALNRGIKYDLTATDFERLRRGYSQFEYMWAVENFSTLTEIEKESQLRTRHMMVCLRGVFALRRPDNENEVIDAKLGRTSSETWEESDESDEEVTYDYGTGLENHMPDHWHI